MSYGVEPRDVYRRAEIYSDKILKGQSLQTCRLKQPAKFELAINLKTAKQIGLLIPVRVLERGNQVIK